MLNNIVVEVLFYHGENGDTAGGRGLILNGEITSHHVYAYDDDDEWWVVLMVMVCVCV